MCVQRSECIFGKLAAALGGIDVLPSKRLESFRGHDDWPGIPVGRQEIAGAVGRDVNTVAPIAATGGEEPVEMFCCIHFNSP